MTRPYFGPLKQDGKPTPLNVPEADNRFFNSEDIIDFGIDYQQNTCELPKTCVGCASCVVYAWSVGCTSDNTIDQVYSRDTNNFGEQRNINKWLTQATEDASLYSLAAAQTSVSPPSGETTIAPDEYWCGSPGLHLVFIEEAINLGDIGSNQCVDLQNKNPDHEIQYLI